MSEHRESADSTADEEERLPRARMVRSVLVLTLASVFSSEAFYLLAALLFPSLRRAVGHLISVLIPLVIAPVLSSLVVRSRYRMELLNRRLKRAREQAEAASRAKSLFLSTVSHEYRTPLTHILGFGELLASDQQMPADERREYLEHILASAKHLLALVEDVLDLSRVEAGEMRFRKRRVDPGQIIQEVMGRFREQARARGIVIKTDVAPPLPSIRVDELRMRQVAYSLLSNALKFTPPGGLIEVSARDESGEHGEKVVHFKVMDTGVGIDKEHLFSIFQPFERARAPQAGVGLGLALAKRLVEAHGGRIWAESRGAGKGSTFHVVLPLDAAVSGAPH